MVSTDLISIFLLSICATPVDALFWNRHDQEIHPVLNPQIRREDSETLYKNTALPASYCGIASKRHSAPLPSSSFTFSPPPLATYKGPYKGPKWAHQGMVVTATVPAYIVCNYLPGATPPASCSTIQDTITTSSCSTTMTVGFDRYPISDCKQSITFSTQSSYSIVTVTPSLADTPPAVKNGDACPSLTYSTYVQNIVTYYVCPWRSLASGDPSGITLVICKTDFAGEVSCENIQEVWVVHTEFVPATVTRGVSVDRFFQYPAVLHFGAGRSMKVDSGNVQFRTSIIYTTTTAHCATSTSRQLGLVAPIQGFQKFTITATSTSTSTFFKTSTTTIYVQDALEDLSAAASSTEQTTTLTSYTTITKTTTILPQTPMSTDSGDSILVKLFRW